MLGLEFVQTVTLPSCLRMFQSQLIEASSNTDINNTSGSSIPYPPAQVDKEKQVRHEQNRSCNPHKRQKKRKGKKNGRRRRTEINSVKGEERAGQWKKKSAPERAIEEAEFITSGQSRIGSLCSAGDMMKITK